jgi:predicted alpha/beta superfamily hydrolase
VHKFLSCLILLSLVAAIAVAAEPRPIHIGETVSLHSDVLDEDRTLMVSTPPGYGLSETRYPVVYLLDAGTNFHHTTGTLNALTRVGHIPEMIVVAMANTDRTRDMTPSPFTPDPAEDGESEGEVRNPSPTAGGADKFLDFFEQELFPYVDKSYRTAPYRVLIGHSFGGLFAIHALVNRPASFDAYVAISPSLWWEDGEVVAQAAETFQNGFKFGRDKTLYMSLASEGGDMLTEYQKFDELLRYAAPSNLTWEGMMMEGDDHGSTPLRSTYHGLKTVFPRWRLPGFVRGQGLAGVQAHYADLSRQYGYEIQVPERTINLLGYGLLGEDKIAEALAVLRHNVATYPKSANVYDSLGDALKAAGELEEALTNYERACARASTDDPALPAFLKNRDDLKAQLAADAD